MSKIIKVIFIVTLLGMSTSAEAQYQDTLLRSAGFFISPGLSNFNITDAVESSDPRFALSGGFRFKNELKKGFFLEGGVGVTLFGATMPVVYDSIVDQWTGEVTNIFGRKSKYEQVHLSTPFLAGYRTKSGKVRFEGAAGFAFNLRIMEHRTLNEFTVDGPYDHTEGRLRPKFGTSFSFIARAGISIPIGNRATIDLLPTLRYAMIYFEPEDMDIGQCLKTEEQKWSAGIDIGFTWKLDDKETEGDITTRTDVKDEAAYTHQYEDQSAVETVKPAKVKPAGLKNFIYAELMGNAMTLSVNYERRILRKDLVSIRARAGFGYAADFFSIPFGVNVGLGKNRKQFEMGLGATAETITTQDQNNGYYHFDVHLVPSIGYRYEASNHFFIRLALVSHYFFDTNEILPGVGISLGGCF